MVTVYPSDPIYSNAILDIYVLFLFQFSNDTIVPARSFKIQEPSSSNENIPLAVDCCREFVIDKLSRLFSRVFCFSFPQKIWINKYAARTEGHCRDAIMIFSVSFFVFLFFWLSFRAKEKKNNSSTRPFFICHFVSFELCICLHHARASAR